MGFPLSYIVSSCLPTYSERSSLILAVFSFFKEACFGVSCTYSGGLLILLALFDLTLSLECYNLLWLRCIKIRDPLLLLEEF